MKTVMFYILAPMILAFFLLGSIGVEIIFRFRVIQEKLMRGDVFNDPKEN